MTFRRLICIGVIACFLATSIVPPQRANAQSVLNLPEPGTMVSLSSAYTPVLIKGLKINPTNPLKLDFIVATGNSLLTAQDPALKQESQKLIKYFFAALTLPENDVWVNLSPYEKDRIVPKATGETEMGRDMLAQDYLLKQITASLIYPEKGLGREFWNKVYREASRRFGTSEIPVNTFNKVWIVADKASVYEAGDTVMVIDSHLKVMLDEDYLSMEKHNNSSSFPNASVGNLNTTHSLASEIVRQIVLPALEKEVNEGKNFANVRQIFHSIILAKWYKETLKTALLNQVYSDKNKVAGLSYKNNLSSVNVNSMPSPNALIEDPQHIYQQYLKAYKKGVFNYIKEDIDEASKQPIPRKYFSGGVTESGLMVEIKKGPLSAAMSAKLLAGLIGLTFVVHTSEIEARAGVIVPPVSAVPTTSSLGAPFGKAQEQSINPVNQMPISNPFYTVVGNTAYRTDDGFTWEQSIENGSFTNISLENVPETIWNQWSAQSNFPKPTLIVSNQNRLLSLESLHRFNNNIMKFDFWFLTVLGAGAGLFALLNWWFSPPAARVYTDLLTMSEDEELFSKPLVGRTFSIKTLNSSKPSILMATIITPQLFEGLNEHGVVTTIPWNNFVSATLIANAAMPAKFATGFAKAALRAGSLLRSLKQLTVTPAETSKEDIRLLTLPNQLGDPTLENKRTIMQNKQALILSFHERGVKITYGTINFLHEVRPIVEVQVPRVRASKILESLKEVMPLEFSRGSSVADQFLIYVKAANAAMVTIKAGKEIVCPMGTEIHFERSKKFSGAVLTIVDGRNKKPKIIINIYPTSRQIMISRINEKGKWESDQRGMTDTFDYPGLPLLGFKIKDKELIVITRNSRPIHLFANEKVTVNAAMAKNDETPQEGRTISVSSVLAASENEDKLESIGVGVNYDHVEHDVDGISVSVDQDRDYVKASLRRELVDEGFDASWDENTVTIPWIQGEGEDLADDIGKILDILRAHAGPSEAMVGIDPITDETVLEEMRGILQGEAPDAVIPLVLQHLRLEGNQLELLQRVSREGNMSLQDAQWLLDATYLTAVYSPKMKENGFDTKEAFKILRLKLGGLSYDTTLRDLANLYIPKSPIGPNTSGYLNNLSAKIWRQWEELGIHGIFASAAMITHIEYSVRPGSMVGFQDDFRKNPILVARKIVDSLKPRRKVDGDFYIEVTPINRTPNRTPLRIREGYIGPPNNIQAGVKVYFEGGFWLSVAKDGSKVVIKGSPELGIDVENNFAKEFLDVYKFSNQRGLTMIIRNSNEKKTRLEISVPAPLLGGFAEQLKESPALVFNAIEASIIPAKEVEETTLMQQGHGLVVVKKGQNFPSYVFDTGSGLKVTFADKKWLRVYKDRGYLVIEGSPELNLEDASNFQAKFMDILKLDLIERGRKSMVVSNNESTRVEIVVDDFKNTKQLLKGTLRTYPIQLAQSMGKSLRRTIKPGKSIQITRDDDKRIAIDVGEDFKVNDKDKFKKFNEFKGVRIAFSDGSWIRVALGQESLIFEGSNDLKLNPENAFIKDFMKKANLIPKSPAMSIKKALFILIIAALTLGSSKPVDQDTKANDATRDGGIDLNASKIDMTHEGSGMQIKFDQALIEQFKRGDFEGIDPVITGITTLPSIYPLLGLNGPEDSQKLVAA